MAQGDAGKADDQAITRFLASGAAAEGGETSYGMD